MLYKLYYLDTNSEMIEVKDVPPIFASPEQAMSSFNTYILKCESEVICVKAMSGWGFVVMQRNKSVASPRSPITVLCKVHHFGPFRPDLTCWFSVARHWLEASVQPIRKEHSLTRMPSHPRMHIQPCTHNTCLVHLRCSY